MTTSRFGAVVDALITAVDTATADTTHVYDGPTVSGDRPTEYVVIGGTEVPDDDAGEFAQEWAGLGKQAKNETGLVNGAVLVASGDDSVKTARDRALVILGQIEDALRADPSLGGVLSSGWCHLSEGRPSQWRNSDGLFARVAFTVAYQCRI